METLFIPATYLSNPDFSKLDTKNLPKKFGKLLILFSLKKAHLN